MREWIGIYWPYVSGAVVFTTAVVAASHAILYKREVRASIGWVGLVLFVPLLGALLYALLGINRIRRKAATLRRIAGRRRDARAALPCSREDVLERFGRARADLASAVGRITSRPLLGGNQATPLSCGDQAYPAMLDAIAGARQSVTMMTFIFDNDAWGRRFVEALVAAHDRGVEVRVLIDAAGVRYTRPPISRALRRAGVPTALFMPIVFARLFHLNLRLHRKLLVVDGELAFSGGLNIRAGHVLEAPCSAKAQQRDDTHRIRDLHFRLEGPIVGQLQETFAEDWAFTSGEELAGSRWFPQLDVRGEVLARAIGDGPDEDLDRMQWTLLVALASARESIRIVTPYFLPEQPIVSALNAAALRGVQVDIVVPERGNLRLVAWAMWAQFWRVLRHGCRLWLSPPPFDHTKLLVIDDEWALFGSTNWDPRSLRLNFELNVEAFDSALAKQLGAEVDARIGRARLLSREELEGRGLPRRLRDGLARLLSPYL
ncbi:MAG: cardiolipin synthase [Proteobacteria bacterium]|nr:MAG: cardiolipin synthase [Pseudomonadota bacterium]